MTMPTAVATAGSAERRHIAESRRAELRGLVEQRIVPLVDDAEERQRFPVEVFRMLGEAGFLSIGAPADQGGQGGGRTAEVMVVEELTRAGAGITMSVVPLFIVRVAIWEFGSPEAVGEVGQPMIRGERVVGISMTEPDAGSDVAAIKTRAVPDGDGYRLTGSKMFTTNGTIADDLLVAARTGDGRGVDGIGLFLLPTDQPGFEAHKLDKECSRASDTTLLHLDGCHVPAHRVVGDPSGGFKRAMRVLNGERILSAARAIRLARLSWEDAVAWAGRHQIGAHAALAYQNVQGPLAAASTDLWVLELGLERACQLWDGGEDCVSEISMLKTLSAVRSVEITALAQSLLGLDGVAEGSRVARNARDARLGTVGAGSDQVMHRILARLNGWPAAVE